MSVEEENNVMLLGISFFFFFAAFHLLAVSFDSLPSSSIKRLFLDSSGFLQLDEGNIGGNILETRGACDACLKEVKAFSLFYVCFYPLF